MHGRQTKRLALLASLSLVTACAAQPKPVFQSFPSAADLAVERKPAPTVAMLTSDKANADYDVAVEAWGERGWRAVGRLCRWAVANGMQDIKCEPAQPPAR